MKNFVLFFLDNSVRILAFDTLFTGTIDRCEIYARVLLKRCLMLNATAVIIAHNHPSGEITPSASDHALTIKLKTTLRIIDVKLLDHVLVGRGNALSFLEECLL